jgi:hypothetical protein
VQSQPHQQIRHRKSLNELTTKYTCISKEIHQTDYRIECLVAEVWHDLCSHFLLGNFPKYCSPSFFYGGWGNRRRQPCTVTHCTNHPVHRKTSTMAKSDVKGRNAIRDTAVWCCGDQRILIAIRTCTEVYNGIIRTHLHTNTTLISSVKVYCHIRIFGH